MQAGWPFSTRRQKDAHSYLRLLDKRLPDARRAAAHSLRPLREADIAAGPLKGPTEPEAGLSASSIEILLDRFLRHTMPGRFRRPHKSARSRIRTCRLSRAGDHCGIAVWMGNCWPTARRTSASVIWSPRRRTSTPSASLLIWLPHGNAPTTTNTAWLAEFVTRRGLPGCTVAGDDGAAAAWLRTPACRRASGPVQRRCLARSCHHRGGFAALP
jgi:hypothetical protein